MDQNVRKKSPLPIIAGALFALSAIIQLLSYVFTPVTAYLGDLSYIFQSPKNFYYGFVSVIDPFITLVILITTAVFLFIGKKPLAGIGFAALGAQGLLGVGIYMIALIWSGSHLNIWIILNTLNWLLLIAAYAVAAILLFLKKTDKGVFKFLWILPGILILLKLFFSFVSNFLLNGSYYYRYFSNHEILRLILNYFVSSIEPTIIAVALALACLWSVKQGRSAVNAAESGAAAQRVRQSAYPPPQQPAWQPVRQGAYPPPARSYDEELVRLKELLDGGVITQEDYEAKKKQLLGL